MEAAISTALDQFMPLRGKVLKRSQSAVVVPSRPKTVSVGPSDDRIAPASPVRPSISPTSQEERPQILHPARSVIVTPRPTKQPLGKQLSSFLPSLLPIEHVSSNGHGCRDVLVAEPSAKQLQDRAHTWTVPKGHDPLCVFRLLKHPSHRTVDHETFTEEIFDALGITIVSEAEHCASLHGLTISTSNHPRKGFLKVVRTNVLQLQQREASYRSATILVPGNLLGEYIQIAFSLQDATAMSRVHLILVHSNATDPTVKQIPKPLVSSPPAAQLVPARAEGDIAAHNEASQHSNTKQPVQLQLNEVVTDTRVAPPSSESTPPPSPLLDDYVDHNVTLSPLPVADTTIPMAASPPPAPPPPPPLVLATKDDSAATPVPSTTSRLAIDQLRAIIAAHAKKKCIEIQRMEQENAVLSMQLAAALQQKQSRRDVKSISEYNGKMSGTGTSSTSRAMILLQSAQSASNEVLFETAIDGKPTILFETSSESSTDMRRSIQAIPLSLAFSFCTIDALRSRALFLLAQEGSRVILVSESAALLTLPSSAPAASERTIVQAVVLAAVPPSRILDLLCKYGVATSLRAWIDFSGFSFMQHTQLIHNAMSGRGSLRLYTRVQNSRHPLFPFFAPQQDANISFCWKSLQFQGARAVNASFTVLTVTVHSPSFWVWQSLRSSPRVAIAHENPLSLATVFDGLFTDSVTRALHQRQQGQHGDVQAFHLANVVDSTNAARIVLDALVCALEQRLQVIGVAVTNSLADDVWDNVMDVLVRWNYEYPALIVLCVADMQSVPSFVNTSFAETHDMRLLTAGL